MKIGTIRQATPSAQTHVVPKEGKIPYTETKVESPRAHKYQVNADVTNKWWRIIDTTQI